jgi:hypothetical protein
MSTPGPSLSTNAVQPGLQTPSYDNSSGSPQDDSSCELPALPIELLPLIFWRLRPEKFRPARGILERSATEYNRAVMQFANLRLLCPHLDSIIKPIVYQEIVIQISIATSRSKIMAVFQSGAPYLRSVVVCGRHPVIPVLIGEAIGRGLGLCTQVQNLECYGAHCMFASREWFSNFTPTLTSTLSFLTIRPVGRGNDLSFSLISLGPCLQSLEIWDLQSRSFGGDSRLQTPENMSNLKELTFRGGQALVADITKLVACAIKNGTYEEERVFFRSLSLINVELEHELEHTVGSQIMTILSTRDLCSHLTTLRLRFGVNQPEAEVGVSVVKACQKLVDFSYVLPADKEIFNYMSPALKHLELAIFLPPHGQHISSTSDFELFLKSRRCPTLRTLSVVDMVPSILDKLGPRFDAQLLRSLCDNLGIEIGLSTGSS